MAYRLFLENPLTVIRVVGTANVILVELIITTSNGF